MSIDLMVWNGGSSNSYETGGLRLRPAPGRGPTLGSTVLENKLPFLSGPTGDFYFVFFASLSDPYEKV